MNYFPQKILVALCCALPLGGCQWVWWGENPALSCQSKTVTLFVNSSGDLAAVESGGVAGLLLVVPFGLYAKHLAIFQRTEPLNLVQ